MRASDKDLVQSFCTSASHAEKHLLFEELIGRYAQKMHNLALRITRSEDETEEVLQDVFMVVYLKLHTFRGDSAFGSWLYRITANTALLQIRNRKRRHAQLPDDSCSTDSGRAVSGNGCEPQTVEDKIARIELRGELEKALGELPLDYRAIFVLRDVDGLSNSEIGKALMMTVPAVKSRLHRSRLMLRRKLQKHYDDYRYEERIFYGRGYYESAAYKMAA